MQESCPYGSVRGAPSNGCPYRNREIALWSKSGLALHLGSLALRRRGPDWNGRPTAEAWAPHREEIPWPHPSVPTASLRSDVFGLGAPLPPGPHTRGKTRALPPCFYRRHRAHSPASLTGRFDLPVGTERARAHRPRLSPIGFPVRQSCCPVLRLGPGLSDILEVTVDRSELSHRRSSISDGRDHGKQFD